VSWVVDASIAVKWVVPEVLSDKADRVRDHEDDVLAPDLLLVEVATRSGEKPPPGRSLHARPMPPSTS
jgi:predicted nucleic acid-binding protein